jgi:hypothetical protein
MHGGELRDYILDAATSWLCDGYELDLRYLALNTSNGWSLIEAGVFLWPLAHKENVSFSVLTPNIAAARVITPSVSKAQAMQVLLAAGDGRIHSDVGSLSLGGADVLRWYSEAATNSTWYSTLQLRVSAQISDSPVHPRRVTHINDELRLASEPFDGLDDLTAQLGIRGSLSGSTERKIEISIAPPCELNVTSCSLRKDVFRSTFLAHPSLEPHKVGFAIRSAPGNGRRARRQVAGEIDWGATKDGLKIGSLSLKVENSDSVLAMLSVAGHTVRRQWVMDPQKAPNTRFVTLQFFDQELRMLHRNLFEQQDAKKFELAVAALLYMLGFSCGLPAETESPDIVIAMPNGESLIVECTMKVADFSSKTGKLVERRAALSRALASANLSEHVTAILVCRLTRDEISATTNDVSSHGILLFAREDIESALTKVRFGQDPTMLLSEIRGNSPSGGFGD